MNDIYQQQVRLLLNVLPEVGREPCFAMHGGTAINFFVHDMPRLSVDIDLTYVPIAPRSESLEGITQALARISQRLSHLYPRLQIKGLERKHPYKLYLRNDRGVDIKVEVNSTMRGTLGNPKPMPLSPTAQEQFNAFTDMNIVPLGQLYGGKICAALDRQHPRDLFDIKLLLETHGFIDTIKRGFLLCLLSSDRPIHELLAPHYQDQRQVMDSQFVGMTEVAFSYEGFEVTRERLYDEIHQALTDKDKAFLLSFKEGHPQWGEYGFADFEVFPALQWKLHNVRKLKQANARKHGEYYRRLEQVLEV